MELKDGEVATDLVEVTEDEISLSPELEWFSKIKCSCGWESAYYPRSVTQLEDIEDAHLAAHVADGKAIAHRFDG